MPRPSLLTSVVVLFVAMLGVMAVAMTQRARAQRSSTAAPLTRVLERVPTPQRFAAVPSKPVAVPPPKPVVAPAAAPEYALARVRPGRTVQLRSKPGGPVLANVAASTQFGSPTTLAVAEQRGKWLAVTSTDLPNGRRGWVRAGAPSLGRPQRTPISIRISLSHRTLELRRGKRVLRRATVGIGRPGSATPTGRFSITDKLRGTAYGPYYGCCILALSGHQVNTPAGWQGGDRLAIHGTNDLGSIGTPSSAGCLHADAADLKVLMRRVPLGTPVFITR